VASNPSPLFASTPNAGDGVVEKSVIDAVAVKRISVNRLIIDILLDW
jgi:hypothetical protein